MKIIISTPWAIIVAGALIAAAIALTNHWVLFRTPEGATVRLNRWTGTAVMCGGRVSPGWELPCPTHGLP